MTRYEQKISLLRQASGKHSGMAIRRVLLAAVLSEFVSRGGDSIFLLFYRDRFQVTVRRLIALDIAIGTGEWWLLSTEESDSRRWRFSSSSTGFEAAFYRRE